MKKLTAAYIIELNRMTIDENGGHFLSPDNFLHGEQLDSLVETIDAKIFGELLYPSVVDKAALYLFLIISNHIFQDGNKRTGLTAALTFLFLNGFKLRHPFAEVPLENALELPGTDYDKDLELLTLAVASAQLSLEECRVWFGANVTKIDGD
jgi:death-on-curing protein